MNRARPSHHTEQVLAVAAADIATPIAKSWRRCLDNYHLDPERPEPPRLLSGAELRYAQDHTGHLLRTADPELDRLHRLVAGIGYAVLMTDRDGATIARRVTDADQHGFQQRRLWPGALWSEEVEGTNGVGTCLTEQHALTVHCGQHFRRRHTNLTCTVAPLFDASGTLAGALDISSFRPDRDGSFLPLAIAAVQETAQRIERACFAAAYPRCMILSLTGVEDENSIPLLAVDSDRRIMGATRGARLALRMADGELHGQSAVADFFANPDEECSDFESAERRVLAGALAKTQGNVSAAAHLLGISRATLHRKLRALGLDRTHRYRA